MKLIEIPQRLQEFAVSRPETGMGYQEVRVRLESIHEKGILIAGMYFLAQTTLTEVAASEAQFNSQRDIFVDLSPPNIVRVEAISGQPDLILEAENNQQFARSARGALEYDNPPFEGKTEVDDVFQRVTAFRNDKRIRADGSVVPGTYATTVNDIQEVPSGLAAVGRYALPTRLPAIYVFRICPPRGTRAAYGTVTPRYGMAGGGVEAYFPDGLPPGSAKFQRTLPVK